MSRRENLVCCEKYIHCYKWTTGSICQMLDYNSRFDQKVNLMVLFNCLIDDILVMGKDTK